MSRVVLVFAALTTLAIGLWIAFRPGLWQRSNQLYWQWRVEREGSMPNTLALDKPVAFRRGELVEVRDPMRGSGDFRFHGDCGGVPAAAWARYSSTLPSPRLLRSPFPLSNLPMPTSYVGPGPTIFVGRLSCPAGDEILHVALDGETCGASWHAEYRSYLFDVTAVSPATISAPASVRAMEYASLQAEHPDDDNYGFGRTYPKTPPGWASSDIEIESIDRGIVDRADPNRFTCEFVSCYGVGHRFEGRLSPDGTSVNFRFLDDNGP